jgi:tripartite-type tricarboxylate transporter receptor subunit TctC
MKLATAAFALLAGVAGSWGAAPPASAADFPLRVVRIVAPAPPGGMSDVYSRLLAARLAERWSQPVIVENRPGTGGYIGAEHVARSAADGHTLLMGTITTNVLTPFLFRAPSYVPANDFVPVALVAEAEGVAVVHPSLPVRTLPELIAYARETRPPPAIASGGIGTAGHLAAEMFRTMTGLSDMEITHYRGMAPMVTDLVAGHIRIGFPTMQTAVGHVRSGSLRGIAVTGAARSVALPDLPTMSEAGLPGFAVTNWIGLFAPAMTPPAVVAQINAEVMRFMETAEMQQRLPRDGGRFRRNTPEQFADFVINEARIWGPVVSAAGVRID